MASVVGPAQSNRLGIFFWQTLSILNILRSYKVEISNTIKQLHQYIFLASKDLIDSIFVEEVAFKRREVGQLLPH